MRAAGEECPATSRGHEPVGRDQSKKLAVAQSGKPPPTAAAEYSLFEVDVDRLLLMNAEIVRAHMGALEGNRSMAGVLLTLFVLLVYAGAFALYATFWP